MTRELQPRPLPEGMLDTAGVAEWLCVPETTLRYWRNRNIGPRSFKLAHRVRYLRADVEAWLEAEERRTSRGGVPTTIKARLGPGTLALPDGTVVVRDGRPVDEGEQ